jgi:dimeric dUTPase (all-alpha-NTP-PPase superfamily)
MDLDDADFYNPLLEEYVDGLHFVMELGLERDDTTLTVPYDENWILKKRDITVQFNSIFDVIGNFSKYRTVGNYSALLDLYMGLGEMLGFTWKDIEQAYFAKNKINHVRQETGY